MMRIRRLAGAQQARLLGHKSEMLPVAVSAWRADREYALVDSCRVTAVGASGGEPDCGLPPLGYGRCRASFSDTTGYGNSASFCAKASSTAFASPAWRLFFSVSAACAQTEASRRFSARPFQPAGRFARLPIVQEQELQASIPLFYRSHVHCPGSREGGLIRSAWVSKRWAEEPGADPASGRNVGRNQGHPRRRSRPA